MLPSGKSSAFSRHGVCTRFVRALPGLVGTWATWVGLATAQPVVWNQPAGGDFNTAGNWTPGVVPGPADIAVFNVATGDVTLSANAAPGSIAFDGGAATFALGTLGGSTFTTANGGSIAIRSTLSGTGQVFTINAAVVLTPDSPTTTGSFQLQNDSASDTTVLVMAGGISSGVTSTTETLGLAGSNTGLNLISGVISNGGAANLALTKSGVGTWVLSGANTFTGGTSIAGGTLILSGGNNRLLGTGTVNFTGSSGTLNVGATSQTLGALIFFNAGTNTHTISGVGGAVTVNGSSFVIGAGSAATASASTTVEMSGLSSFTYSLAAGAFNVGGTTDNGSAASTGVATLNLATTNTITAASFNLAHFSTGSNSLNSGIVHLGQTNTINATTINIGANKTTAMLDFQNLVAPTLKIRGTNGTDADRANMTIGVNDSGITGSVATVDLTSAGAVTSTLDARLGTLMIGQNKRNNAGLGQAATGTFVMGLGVLDATTIVVGQQDAVSGSNLSGNATGTFSLYGGTVTATTLTLANKLAVGTAQTINSNINLYSGTLNATTIQRGTAGTSAGVNTASINFNWVDGVISNVAGANQTVNGRTAVNGLTGGLNIVLNDLGNTSGTHTWNVSGTQTSTVQSTVTLSGAGGLTKTGTGALIFEGANTYAGTTVINGGLVRFATRAGLYNGNASSWTPQNLVVGAGGAAAFNVGGAGEFTLAEFEMFKSMGTMSGGFKNGSAIGIDTTNASGTVVLTTPVTNTNNGSNALGLVKLGTGTLELNGVNTYTGPTTIGGGTLLLSGGNNRLLTTGVLNFTGNSGTLDLGSGSQTLAGMSFAIAGVNNYTITGAAGALNVTGGSFHVGGGNLTTATGFNTNTTTVNMSGLGTFGYTQASGTFSVGGRADIGGGVSGAGTLTLAAVNTITASRFSVSPVSSGNSSPNTGIVHLGQTNTINASTFEVGVGKATSLLDFQALNSPTLKIRGTGGTNTDRAAVTIGNNDSGVVANTATMDLVTGITGASTLDAKVSTMVVGQNTRNATSLGQASTATFTMGLGVLDATSIVVGQQGGLTGGNTFSGAATGTFNLYGGTVMTSTLTLANKASGAAVQTITSNFNLYSGTLQAVRIERGALGTGAGADVATINFNWVDGTIGNVTGLNQTVDGKSAVNGLTGGLNLVLNNAGNVSGTHTWNVSGAKTSTLQATVTLSGAGGLTKTGTGTLVFSGVNSYTGQTVVEAGGLDLNATGGVAVAGNLRVNSTGTVRLLQANQVSAASTLEVNGGTFALQTFSQAVAGVQLKSGGAITGTTGVLTSATAFDLQSGTSTAILAGNAGAVKSTTGTVVLSGASTYTGGTTVNGGTLVAAHASALGAVNNNLTVATGANFTYRPATAGALNLGSGVLTLQTGSTLGTSLGGSLSQSAITSTAVASASGPVQVNVYGISGVTPAAGVHNLVSTGGGLANSGATYTAAYYNLTNATVSNFQATDTAIRVTVTSATALGNAYWKGGLGLGVNVWALSDGTSSNWVTNANGTGVTALVPGSGANVIFSATGSANQAAMVLGANMSIRSLVVDDTGGIKLDADGSSLTVSNAAGITVNAGAGAVTLNAPLILGASQTWTNNSTSALTIGGPVTGAALNLTVTGSGNTAIAGALSGSGTLTKTGLGTLTLSGANTFTGPMSVNAGRVNLSGSYLGAINVANVANATGVLYIQEGSRLLGDNMALMIGNAAGSVGALYMTGGDVLLNNNLNLGLAGAVGARSYGFFSMSGGTFSDTPGTNVRFRIGGGFSNSTGVFYQSGGMISVSYQNGLEVGANATGNFTDATGVAYFTGGSFTANANRIGYNTASSVMNGMRGEQTVAGTAEVTINGTTNLAQVMGDTGILNLNGGIYATRQIATTSTTNRTSIVNFNGGTLKAASSANNIFLTGLTRANIYAGGATIDTNGQSITIGQALLAPDGSGVATVAVANGGSGYVGAPLVVISGDGTGATAVANMEDDGTGNGTFRVASITITSAGTSYTTAPTVTLSGGGGTGAVLGTVATAANVSGGITKTGNGTLTLSGANTYTGATVVSAGVLAAGSTSAFGINSAATVNGVLRFSGRNIALGSLAGSSNGIVENASNTAATLTLGGDNSSTEYSGLIQNGTGTGALSVEKTGSGVQTFTGVNTYTGATTVSQGTLQVGVKGQGSTAASSPVTVNGAAALAGTGTVAGTVSVTTGFIRPGDSGGAATGALNVGALNLGSSGTAVFQIEGTSSYDSLNVINAGGLTLNGTLIVTTSLQGGALDSVFASGATFNLLDWVGTINSSFDVGANLRDGSGDTGAQFDLPDISSLSRYWDVSQFLTNGTIVVVPEPGRMMLVLLGLVFAVVRRRR